MSSDPKATRRTVLAGATGVTASGLVTPGPASASRAQAAAGARVLVEMIGQVVQDGTGLRGFGYCTRIRGVARDRLFDGPPTEAAARFTWAASASMEDHFVRGEVRVTVATGTLTFHAGPGGGDFADPDTFAAGERIASFAVRFHDTLIVIAPDQAVTMIEGELRQTGATAFAVGGRRRRLGRRGERMHLVASGPGRRTDPVVPRAVFDVAGRLSAAR